MVDTNFIYGPIYGIRTLMANSETFRTAVSAATVNAGKAVIYPFEVFDENYDSDNTAASRPRVILGYDANATRKQSTSGWNSGYAVRADFEFLPTDDNDQVAVDTFLSTVNDVVAEMLALQGTDGHVIVEMVEAADSVLVMEPDDTPGGVRYLWYGVRFIRELD